MYEYVESLIQHIVMTNQVQAAEETTPGPEHECEKQSPEDIFKALISFGIFLLGFTTCSLVTVLTQDKEEKAFDLQDVVLDNVSMRWWAPIVSQMLLLFSNLVTIMFILSHHHSTGSP